MVHQNPFTLLTPVRPDASGKLKEILEKFKVGLHMDLNERFKQLGTLHYARWFILREDSFRDKTAFSIPERLVFSSNFDGEIDDHVEGLVTVFPEYFDELYECCEGYPVAGERSLATRKQYLVQWKVKPAAFYIGAPGRGLQQIQQEDRLREFIRNFVIGNNWKGQTAAQIHQAIRDEVDKNPQFEWSDR